MSNCSDLIVLTQFADDSTATLSSDTLEKAMNNVERELHKVLDWLATNKLIINLSKTHLMLFTNLARPDSISIKVKGYTLKEVKETKFLGIILDHELKWKPHIDYISTKISKSVSIFKMLKFTFPSTILKNIYFSLIYPYYTYCNLVWGSAAHTHLDSIIKLPKKLYESSTNLGT